MIIDDFLERACSQTVNSLWKIHRVCLNAIPKAADEQKLNSILAVNEMERFDREEDLCSLYFVYAQ